MYDVSSTNLANNDTQKWLEKHSLRQNEVKVHLNDTQWKEQKKKSTTDRILLETTSTIHRFKHGVGEKG